MGKPRLPPPDSPHVAPDSPSDPVNPPRVAPDSPTPDFHENYSGWLAAQKRKWNEAREERKRRRKADVGGVVPGSSGGLGVAAPGPVVGLG